MSAEEAEKHTIEGGFWSLSLLDNRYPVLHGLRFVAILSVIQYHVTWIFAAEQGIVLDPRFVQGSLSVFFGMDLFFILSGFLIGSILLASLPKQGKTSASIGRFYLRRVFRTFPPYYVVLTVIALYTVLTPDQRNNLLSEYTYLTNFFSLRRDKCLMFWGWSLSLEEQFYLVVPLLFLVLRRIKNHKTHLVVLAGLWALGLLARIVVYLRGRPWTDLELYSAVYFRTHTRFDTLVCGIFLAYLEQRFSREVDAFLASPMRKGLLLVGSLLCVWLVLNPDLFGNAYVQPMHILSWGTLTSLLYAGALLVLLRSKTGLAHALSHARFRSLATLGYGVYLVHIPIIDHWMVPLGRQMAKWRVPWLALWLIATTTTTLLALGIAYLLHVFVEKPSLKLRDRFAR
jgi:peptidoglycan/LPS O-acetylase OafA/YrhL